MTSPLTLFSIASASIAALILVGFLVKRPALDSTTRTMLLLGLGVFPIGAAASANVQGYEATTARTFCGSCHVMTPYAADSNDPKSKSLASRHARNPWFGERNCYTCHADYGMFGTLFTKLGGMRHVWLYYTEYAGMPLAESEKKIHIRKPYPNENCMQCHSTDLQGWLRAADHRAALADVRAGRVSCASPGCHGYAHPFTKPDAAGLVPAELAPLVDGGAGAGAGAGAAGDAGR